MYQSLAIVAQISGDSGPGIVELFMRSGLTAKIVFAILGIMSVGSWAIIVSKFVEFHRAAGHTERFLEVFHRSQRFSEVNAAADTLRTSPLVAIFQSGYVEIDAQVKASAENGSAPSGAGYRLRSLEGLQSTLQRAVGVELQVMSRGTGFLATTAAASPFIGLFGTVVGHHGRLQRDRCVWIELSGDGRSGHRGSARQHRGGARERRSRR